MGLTSKPLDRVRADVPLADVTKEDGIIVNIVVPVSLKRRWKFAAVSQDRTLSSLVIEAVNEYLARQEAASTGQATGLTKLK